VNQTMVAKWKRSGIPLSMSLLGVSVKLQRGGQELKAAGWSVNSAIGARV